MQARAAGQLSADIVCSCGCEDPPCSFGYDRPQVAIRPQSISIPPDALEYDPGPHKPQVATLEAPDSADEQRIRAYSQERPAAGDDECPAETADMLLGTELDCKVSLAVCET